jgi:NADH-quinone oxidoreductase subunit N
MYLDLAVIVLAFIVLIIDLFNPKNRRLTGYCALGGLFAVAVLGLVPTNLRGDAFLGMYILDPMAVFFKVLAVVITFIVILLSLDYMEKKTPHTGEYYALLLFICSGVMVMSSAADLVALFIALELVSIPLYVLSGYLKFDRKSSEAGFKYFVLGAFSSGLLLYGMSFIYGNLGTTSFSEITVKLTGLGPQFPHAVLLGLILMIAAFGFKIAMAPFHMWAPDVYEGAPTPVTAFISVAPKAAGLAIMIRFFYEFLNVMRPYNFTMQWSTVLAVLAVFTMFMGNLFAIPQTNFKRMLAYSGVAQIGYLIVGLCAVNVGGTASLMFYMLVYALANLGAFGVLIACSSLTGSDEIEGMAGFAKRSPGLALVMLLCLLSLAGAPPLAGFVGKFYIFAAAFNSEFPLMKVVVIVAIINSVISLYYYFGVLKAMYFKDPADETPVPVTGAFRLAMGCCVLGVVLLGLCPALPRWLMSAATLLHP